MVLAVEAEAEAHLALLEVLLLEQRLAMVAMEHRLL
jgi:hypothetical protein